MHKLIGAAKYLDAEILREKLEERFGRPVMELGERQKTNLLYVKMYWTVPPASPNNAEAVYVEGFLTAKYGYWQFPVGDDLDLFHQSKGVSNERRVLPEAQA